MSQNFILINSVIIAIFTKTDTFMLGNDPFIYFENQRRVLYLLVGVNTTIKVNSIVADVYSDM